MSEEVKFDERLMERAATMYAKARRRYDAALEAQQRTMGEYQDANDALNDARVFLLLAASDPDEAKRLVEVGAVAMTESGKVTVTHEIDPNGWPVR